MSGELRISCCQLAPPVGHPDDAVELAREALTAAIDDGAQIVVLPELVNSGYVFESLDEAREAAVGADGELFEWWAREARRGEAIVIGGFCELGDDGTLFNSCALVDGDGVRAVYRKIHLWGEEPLWFAAGDQPAPVVETRYGRIGLAICYDIEFPELTRGLALAGADLLALPTNWPRDPDGVDPRPILHSLALTTAYLNRVFVAVCDRCGVERGVEFEAGSVIAAPYGKLLTETAAERAPRTVHADVDLLSARHKRTGPRNDAFEDRRPDQYGSALVES